MRKDTVGNLTLYQFESFEEYLDRADNPKYKIIKKENPSGWGSVEWQTQMMRARMGWSDLIQDIDKWRGMVVEEISQQLPKPEMHYDKVGSFWDVGRVIENDPDCWTDEIETMVIEKPGKGNIVRLVINTASSAQCRSVFHTRRCGVILALTQLLEMMGFYIQFEITTAIQVLGRKLEFRTVAKEAHQVLNTAAIAYWSSEFMERHIDFSICETMEECAKYTNKFNWQEKKNTQYVHLHYGSPIGTYDPGDVCFDRGHAGDTEWHSDEAAKNYVRKQLMRQGVILEV